MFNILILKPEKQPNITDNEQEMSCVKVDLT